MDDFFSEKFAGEEERKRGMDGRTGHPRGTAGEGSITYRISLSNCNKELLKRHCVDII